MQDTNRNFPLVSIIMPTFNRAEFLVESVKNILSQTYHNLELIIIDDCSTDKTSEVISSLARQDLRIKPLKNIRNEKIIKTLNYGLREARGKYIARADDDDPWVNINKLEKQVLFLESNPEYAIIGTGTIVIDETKKELFRYRQPNSDRMIRSKMLFGNPFIHSTVVFRKSILDKTGFYDESLKDAEDWDLWMRIGKYGKLYNFISHDTCRFYGTRGLSIKNRLNISKTRLALVKKYRKDYPYFIPAFFFNFLQRLYTFFPYIKAVDDLMFKLKRKVFMR